MAGAKLRITAPPASADDALPRCFPLRISRHVPRARALQHAALANGSISSDDTVRSATTLPVRCACSTRVSIQNQHRAGGGEAIPGAAQKTLLVSTALLPSPPAAFSATGCPERW